MEVTRIFDILKNAKHNYSHIDDLLCAKKNGTWQKYNINEYIDFANNFSYGLLELGFKAGDKIASISNNRPEWNFIDMGMLQIGAVHVPVYPTLGRDEFRHVLSHSDAKILIVANKSLYIKLSSLIKEIPNIAQIYTFDHVEGARNWEEILEIGKKNRHKYKLKLEEIKSQILPDDLATIIYTSGTTGVSKGVMLSHKNLLSNALSTDSLNLLKTGYRALSFLPLSHVYERMVNLVYQYEGISLYYAESIASIGDNIRELQVNGFVAVPRVLESVFSKIVKAGQKRSGAQRKIFDWALKLAYKYELNGKNGWLYEQKLKLADKLVYSKWRNAVGGNIRFIACGGAAMQRGMEKVFWAAKIPIYQGYGLTETSPIISVNYGGNTPHENTVFGTVGPALSKVEIKLSDEGEILTRGDCVMKGYYKNPEMTKEVIDEEGWFHTGDIGEMDENGYLTITDRKKEIFKTSSGKYIAPQRIENMLKQSHFIEQLMVVGANQKYASAIISPNFSFLHDWCSREKIEFKDNQELIENPVVLKQFQKEVAKFNRSLGQTEQIKKFKLVSDEWTPVTGELSPTLKLKRKILYDRYDTILESLYSKKQQQ